MGCCEQTRFSPKAKSLLKRPVKAIHMTEKSAHPVRLNLSSTNCRTM